MSFEKKNEKSEKSVNQKSKKKIVIIIETIIKMSFE